jgi:exodeoxyribonuclease V alpha subunit
MEQSGNSAPGLISLRGVIERITYSNPDNGYTVARFQVADRFGLITLVGNLAEVHPGARLTVHGRWKSHPKYGEQFEIERYAAEAPATLEGLKRYLGSGLIKGIGPVMAGRIAEHFGVDTLEVIENDIGRLAEVEGIGPKRVGMITQAWQAQKQIKEIMLFLQSHQVSTQLAIKIYKSYGDQAIRLVREEPYRLARDIYGIGFITADKIARSLGIAADAPQRIAAGIEYSLNQLADQGHVFGPRDHLIQVTAKMLAVQAEQVALQLDLLQQQDQIIIERVGTGPEPIEAVYLKPFYYAELGVARQVKLLLATETSRLAEFKRLDWPKAFAWLRARQKEGFQLAEHQQRAVQVALTRSLSILTGGPGTGKTSTVRAILQLLASKGKSALLAAPTGRAAKRLAESTGREAKTIHRLLEVSPGEGFKFQRNQENPLPADLLIIDECSMIDLILMNHLLKAVHLTSHLLLVGDADQLPSVGAGNVLGDLIASGVIPVTRLEVIFRQAAGSAIISNAHRINRGEMPIFPKS